MTDIGDTLAEGIYTIGEHIKKGYILIAHRFVLFVMLWVIVEIWWANHSLGWNLIFSPISRGSILFWIFLFPFILGVVGILMTVDDFTPIHHPFFILVALFGLYMIYYAHTTYPPLFHDIFYGDGIFMGGLVVLFSWLISIGVYYEY